MSLDQPPIGIVALAVHAREVSTEARERFAELAAAVARDRHVILLRTCHRVELYAFEDGTGESPLADLELPSGGRRLEGDSAVRHLFTVAAGLDSVVMGEDEILHQLRQCLTERQVASLESADEECVTGQRPALPPEAPGELEPLLDRLFQLALHVGRQSRAWREGPRRSLADVALDRIEAAVGAIAGRPLLVVGAGKMSRLTALAGARRHAQVVVSNRTAERAHHLASDVAGQTVAFGAVPTSLAGVVLALSGPWITDTDAEQVLLESDALVVDLSSPPAVRDSLRDRLGSRLVTGDDIARGPVDPVRDRVRRRFERLIDEASTELNHWASARAAVPAIQALTQAAEARRLAELDRLLRRLPNLDAHDRELVEQMSQRLVAGLLHAPLASLREDETGEHDRAARQLFSL